MIKGLAAQATLLVAALLVTAPALAGDVEVQRAGYALQAEQHGDGATVVVFEPGFGQGPGVWKDVIAGLGADCRCIAYARAGLGRSGTDGKPKTIEAHVQDLGAVIDTLAPGRKLVLVGHSYGGLLATEFARQHPERLQGLVLVDPATLQQRHAFKAADRDRVAADDKALLSMLPPPMRADYALLVSQLDSADAASPRAMPDVPVALLTRRRSRTSRSCSRKPRRARPYGSASMRRCSQATRAGCTSTSRPDTTSIASARRRSRMASAMSPESRRPRSSYMGRASLSVCATHFHLSSTLIQVDESYTSCSLVLPSIRTFCFAR